MALALESMVLALASKDQALALALRAALTFFGIIFKRKKDNKINKSYNNNKLIIIYV